MAQDTSNTPQSVNAPNHQDSAPLKSSEAFSDISAGNSAIESPVFPSDSGESNPKKSVLLESWISLTRYMLQDGAIRPMLHVLLEQI